MQGKKESLEISEQERLHLQFVNDRSIKGMT
jgi:hypothetical protein